MYLQVVLYSIPLHFKQVCSVETILFSFKIMTIFSIGYYRFIMLKNFKCEYVHKKQEQHDIDLILFILFVEMKTK